MKGIEFVIENALTLYTTRTVHFVPFLLAHAPLESEILLVSAEAF